MQNYGNGKSRIGSAATLLVAPVVIALIVSTVGCAQFNRLKAMKVFKEANSAYAGQKYKEAAELYEQAIQMDPNLNYAYFYLANSYDQQFRAVKKGDAE